MQIAEIVYLADVDARGIVEHITTHPDVTVYAVRTLDGTLYARTVDELAVVTDEAERAELRSDFAMLAPHHAELRAALVVLGIAQARAWYLRHNLDKPFAITAEAILAARTVDHEAALALDEVAGLTEAEAHAEGLAICASIPIDGDGREIG